MSDSPDVASAPPPPALPEPPPALPLRAAAPHPHPTVQLLHEASPTRDTIHQLFLPYRRISPPWTVYERVKTAFACVFLLPIRVLYLVLSVAVIAALASIANIGLSRPPSAQPAAPELPASQLPAVDYDDDDPLFAPIPAWRRFVLSLLFPVARAALFVSLGVVRVRRDAAPLSAGAAARTARADGVRAFVVVANHLGYIDILILLVVFRASFVAKGECEHTALVGLVARALQCMFVRAGRSLTAQLVARVRSTHHCHLMRETCVGCAACQRPLVIFPEGTTANGTAMIPFRSGVFNAGLPVRPVCIRFPHRHFNLSWETIRFREHAFRAMTQLVNHVHCTEMPVYVPSKEEVGDARLYAANVQREMAAVLGQEVIPLNRKHKLLYHSYLCSKEEGEARVLEKAKKLLDEDEQLQYFLNNVANKGYP